MRVKSPFPDLSHAFDASGIWRSKGIPHSSCALCLISVKVVRSGGNRCVAQVVTHRRQLYTARQSMCGVRMSHPVWTCPAQLFGSLWRFGLNDVGSYHEYRQTAVTAIAESDTALSDLRWRQQALTSAQDAQRAQTQAHESESSGQSYHQEVVLRDAWSVLSIRCGALNPHHPRQQTSGRQTPSSTCAPSVKCPA
jgi:hypothetical protein